MQVKGSLSTIKQKRELAQVNLTQYKNREKILLQKAGEMSQFGSARKRDAYLTQEISTVTDGVKAKGKQKSIHQEELESLSCEIAESVVLYCCPAALLSSVWSCVHYGLYS